MLTGGPCPPTRRPMSLRDWRSQMTNCTRLTRAQFYSSVAEAHWWVKSRAELAEVCTIGRAPLSRVHRVVQSANVSVAVGIMAQYIMDRRTPDSSLLDRAAATWLPNQGRWLSVLVVHHCPSAPTGSNDGDVARRHGNSSVPQWLARGVSSRITWRCFAVDVRRTAKRNNYRKLTHLLTLMLDELPARDFYLKIDLDTLVVPASLVRFLARVPLHAHTPLYVGSIEATELLSGTRPECGPVTYAKCSEEEFCDDEDRFCERAAKHSEAIAVAGADDPKWQPEAPACSGMVKRGRAARSKVVCYGAQRDAIQFAQGGAYGVTRTSLRRLVESDCIARVGRAPCFAPSCFHRGEDATLGICLHRLAVPLWQCPCFHPTGPCDVSQPADCNGRICERPITVHKLRRPQWLDQWWAALTL